MSGDAQRGHFGRAPDPLNADVLVSDLDDTWDDSDDPHDALHRWYHAGCSECDTRADWLEASRP